MLNAAILTFFPACLILATVCDITTMKIPNKVILALLAGFAVAVPFVGMSVSTLGLHIGVAAIVFVLGFAAWMIGVFGAGDVKLLAACSLLLGPAQTVPYLAFVGLIGGVAIVAILVFRSQMLPAFLLQVGWIHRLHQPRSAVPYGIALGPAALLAFLESPLASYAINGTPIG